ncbi:MAG: protein of unknown function DUF891 [uncultured bacterium]|nr:MAG: protein of unknown function DUF891 [uncultured bacterium]
MNIEWNIEFYQKENGEIPITEFLDSLDTNHKKKAFRGLDLLKELGTDLREPYSKSIKGKKYKNLWELRIQIANNISRIFYFIPVGETIVLLHGFIKKTQKTPEIELERAKKYMDDYVRRFLK